jgi:hypothetical protein
VNSALFAEVRTACAELTAVLARADPAAAQRLPTAAAEPAATAPVVLVAGAPGVGKSSLVNALIDLPGLSPPGTAVPLLLCHGPQLAVAAHWADGPGAASLPVQALRDWPSLLAAVAADVPPPGYVTVNAPVPLLARLNLVDTPGVAGFDTALGAAVTAVLLVRDAGAPLSHSELDFLHRTASDVDTVLIALTRVDAHRGWRQVLDADRALLAEHAPRFADAPLHPVSPRLAAMAATAPTEELAAQLRLRSGIALLQADLQRVVTHRSELLAAANSLRAVHSALTAATLTQHVLVQSLQGEPSAAAVLRARREGLAQQRRVGSRGAAMRLRTELQRARVESSHEVAKGVRDTQARFRAAADAADRATLATLPAQLDAALGQLGRQVSRALADRVVHVAHVVLAEMFSTEEIARLAADTVHPDPVDRVPRPVRRRASAAEDRLVVVAGASGGVGLGKLALAPVALVPGLNVVVLPLTLGLGAGAAWWLARTRAHQAERAHLKAWSAELLAEARAGLDQLVAEQLIDVEHQIGVALDDALGRRSAQIDRELRELDVALRQGADERARSCRDAVLRHGELTVGLRRAELLLAGLQELRRSN